MHQPLSDLFSRDSILPRLRSDLVISRQKFRGKTSYIVKDPISLRYYRLGTQELYVAGLLDGKRSLSEVTERMQQKFPDADIDDAVVARILVLFLRMNFVQLSGQQGQTFFTHLLQERRKRRLRQLGLKLATGVFYFKVRLFDPDIFLLQLEKRLRFMWSRTTAVGLACLVALSVGLLFWNLDRLGGRLPDFFTPHNLFLLWVTLILVKVLHEFGHGLTCKHYGGEMHQMGALFIVLTPFLYCDATDSWMFPNKWHRIAVNMGGILVELFLASTAAILWVVTQPGLINQLAFNIMIVCSVSTIVFNGNPLMKFDGYYVLADWLEVPNLRDRARQSVHRLIEKHLVGTRTSHVALESHGRLPAVFPLYAVASYLYMWFVVYRIARVVGIKLAPYGLAAVGETMALLSVLGGAALPLYSLAKDIRTKLHTDMRGLMLGRLSRVAAFVSLGILALFFLPWKLQVTSNSVLDGYRERVYAKTAGFVRKLPVKEGDFVHKQHLLAVLENEDLVDQLYDIEQQMQLLELQMHRAAASNDTVAVRQYSLETAKLEAVRSKLRQDLSGLELKATTEGIVLTAELERKQGTHLRPGELFCEILPLDELRVVLSLTEREAGLVREGQRVAFRVSAFPGKLFRGKVTKTYVSASYELPHAALAARFGGDVPSEQDVTGRERPSGTLYQAELLIKNTDQLLRPGMSGRSKIDCGWANPGRILLARLKEILRLDFQL